jgi:hypothetical protein
MTPSNKPVAVHFGGGNIGRGELIGVLMFFSKLISVFLFVGFIGALLSQAGFHVISWIAILAPSGLRMSVGFCQPISRR